MTQPLHGRVALITGATSPIGSAAARALADEGVFVVIGYLTSGDRAVELADELAGDTVSIDVLDPKLVNQAFDDVERDHGKVDILVNNAGLLIDRPVKRMADEDFLAVIDANLMGAFRCIRRAVPAQARRGWGRIVSIGSVAGSVGIPTQANYAAAKAGLAGMTRSVASEYARVGVTANVVAPGLVNTPMVAHLTDRQRGGLLRNVWMGRSADPDEIAEGVRFCCRASYLTGQVVAFDGGLA